MGMKKKRVTPAQILVFSAALLVTMLYVGFSAAGAGPGFPLDDSWIHQTYARNLVQSGQWAYFPGESSAGSTAPLWTLLLAVGYGFRLPYLFWAYLWGGLSLVLLAGAGMAVWRTIWPEHRRLDWLVGLSLVFTWPLVWAAASGMETLLFMALGMLLVYFYVKQDERFTFWSGLLAGLLVLVRPEGLLLLLLIAVGLLLRPGRVGSLLRFGTAAALPLVPYFLFNLGISGTPWPNTFYAKQVEYLILLDRPLLERYLSLLWFSLGGADAARPGMTSAHLLLLPGILAAGWKAFRRDWTHKQLHQLLPLLWALGHVALYAWRLPVTYQHGRYLWATLPIWILYGLAGWLDILGWLMQYGSPGRIARRVAAATYMVVLIIFFVLGGQAYAQDVAFIEGEMVQVAHWLQENTEPEALIAAHDIGAIGYFSQRTLLDTAGLVSPEIIPFLTDEQAMASYIEKEGADYLVTAPGWPYTTIASRPGVRLLFETMYPWTREQGQNNMAVYQLP